MSKHPEAGHGLLKTSKEVEPFMCLGFLTSSAACPTSGEISGYSEDAKWNPMIIPTAVNPINPDLGRS